MNAFRNSRVVILFALLAVLALSLSATAAKAGGNNHGHHGHNFHASHHINHFNYGHYYPIYKYVAKPVVYPVTYYDCYGQPYVVWQTSYQSVPTTYFGY